MSRRLAALAVAGSLMVGACTAAPAATPVAPTETDGVPSPTAPAATAPPATPVAPSETEDPTAAPTIGPGHIEKGTAYPEGVAGYDWERALADEIERDHPGTTIELIFANTPARPALEQRWRGGDPPDIDFSVFIGVFPETYEYVDLDVVLDLTPYMEAQLPGTDTTWRETFLPLTESFTTDSRTGSIYAVPSELTTFGLILNQQIFDRLGLAAPTTWDELLSVGDSLKAEGIAPISLAGTIDVYNQLWYDHLLLRECPAETAFNAIQGISGSVKDDPCFLRAAQKLQQLRDGGYFHEGFEGRDAVSSQIEFLQGNAAMILMGSWLPAEMADSTPEGFVYSINPFPSIPGGEGDQDALFGFLNQLVVAKASDNIDLAIEFLRRFTAVENQIDRVATLGLTSPVVGVPSPEALQGVDALLTKAASPAGMQTRYWGLEKQTVRWENYRIEIQGLLLGAYPTAEDFIDGLDAVLGDTASP